MSTGFEPNVCVAPSIGVAPLSFAGALQYFAASQCILPISWPPSATVSNLDEFDFIVVGAGTAGSVIASRLSEISQWKVLLIEAGGDPPVESMIPALHPFLVNSSYNWDTTTVNNSYSGQALKRFRISRGKGLGGGSSINFMMYVRGNKADYDGWAAKGNHGWDWDSVLPYFKRCEQIFNPVILNQSYVDEYHNVKGDGIKISRAQNFDEEYERFLLIFNETGFNILPENNGPQQLGFSYTDFTIYNGIRESTAYRYLLPHKDRSNLYILKNAFVNKVIIEGENKLAKGVEIVVNNKTIEVMAKKEIIISGGAIGSAEILLKSGVGPIKDLTKININVIADLPVGKNFHDHVFVPLIITGKPVSVDLAALHFGFIEYLYNQKGIHSSGPVPLINGFIALNSDQTYPDIQVGAFYFKANDTGLTVVCSDVFQYSDIVCESLQYLNSETEILFIAVVLLHPKSRGYITLNNKEDLIVNPKYLCNKNDLLKLKEGLLKLLPIIKAPSFKDANPSVGKLNINQCNEFTFLSDEYWTCYVKNMASSLLHPVGSCSMGSVVDERLKVFGISRLRIADASIMPSVTSGNTNTPVNMIGEKAADMIKNDYL